MKGLTHPQCHRPPRHCCPYSQHLRRSATAGGCSDHSCTGTGPYHSAGCSLSAGTGTSSPIRPLGSCPKSSETTPFLVLLSPHPSRLHSRDRRHTSSAQRCSGRWHRKTHSQSRAEALRRDRPQQGGHRASPGLRNTNSQTQGSSLRLSVKRPQLTHGVMIETLNQSRAANWLSSRDWLGREDTHTYPIRYRHTGEGTGPWSCP